MTQTQETNIRKRARIAVDQWGDTVYRLALSRTRCAEDAHDIFQNVFLKFIQNNKTFESKDHEKAWLLKTTVNCSIDLHRSAWKQKQVPFEEKHEALLETSEDQRENDEPPFPLLEDALDELSEIQRTVIHLFYYEEYSTAEIANLLNENPSTVRTHLSRGRSAIKKMLGVSDE